MYIIPTVTGLSNLSPVWPFHKWVCPEVGKLAKSNIRVISLVDAPSKTGVAIGTPLDKFSINSAISLFESLEIVFS